jgi:hypothetical protein
MLLPPLVLVRSFRVFLFSQAKGTMTYVLRSLWHTYSAGSQLLQSLRLEFEGAR